MKCPLCRSTDFYVKDPHDSFTTYPFSSASGVPQFSAEVEPDEAPAIGDQSETFCSRCAWHGRLGTLQP